MRECNISVKKKEENTKVFLWKSQYFVKKLNYY